MTEFEYCSRCGRLAPGDPGTLPTEWEVVIDFKVVCDRCITGLVGDRHHPVWRLLNEPEQLAESVQEVEPDRRP
ncbi:MAG: hypothetical protein ACRDPQ_07085 [Nocardioidaceae bacterium]